MQIPCLVSLMGLFLLPGTRLWPNKHDIMEWTKLMFVCKCFKPYLAAVHERHFVPFVKSVHFLSLLATKYSNLRHLTLDHAYPLSFANLRTIYSEQIPFLTVNNLYEWNCPHLEYLILPQTRIQCSDVLHTLSVRCPKLKDFCFIWESNDDCLLSKFMFLEQFQIKVAFQTTQLKLHISNMPMLQKVDIASGMFESIEFGHNVGQLQTLESQNGYKTLNLIFHESVPLLTHVDAGYGATLHLDPHQFVDWNHIKSLTLCMNVLIFYKLQSVQNMCIVFDWEQNNVFSFNHLPYLRKLMLCEITNDILLQFAQSATCKYSLVELSIRCKEKCILNLEVLNCFQNLKFIYIRGGRYCNFESVLHLPNVVEIMLPYPVLRLPPNWKIKKEIPFRIMRV